MKNQTSRTTKPQATKRAKRSGWTIGIDLGDQWSRYCVIDGEGAIIEEGRLQSTPTAVEKQFADLAPTRIAMEAGMQSLWVSSLDDVYRATRRTRA